jgi:FlaA1/EpsC-like NDP-sugar epimerase
MSLNYNIIGFIDDDIHKKNLTVLGIPILGGQQDLSRIVKEKNIDEIIISFQSSTNDEMEKIYTICRKTNVSFKRAKWSLDSVNV